MNMVSDVFGVKKNMVLSYIERENVDGKFEEALRNDKHIIIYGASKQGKSALVLKHLNLKECITINCSPKMEIKDIYNSLLRQIGVQIESSREEVKESNGEISLKTGFKALLPFIGQANTELAGKAGDKKGDSISYHPVEFNLEIAQDISEILKKCKFNKWIIIENFHYLKDDIQKLFAFDLRTFQDTGYKFIILGIWRERNRLLQFNRDLIDRVIEIPVEPWKGTDFDKVISKGCNLLKITFSQEICEKIKENSFGNIGIVQELCKETCYAVNLLKEQVANKTIQNDIYLKEAMDVKLNEYSASHMRSLETIAGASIHTHGLYMPYFLIKIIVQEDINSLKNGIARADLPALFKNVHYRPDDVRSSDITYLLNNLAALQIKNKISPPLFDYDIVGRKLRIIDSTLMFFLKFKNKDDILEDIYDPTE